MQVDNVIFFRIQLALTRLKLKFIQSRALRRVKQARSFPVQQQKKITVIRLFFLTLLTGRQREVKCVYTKMLLFSQKKSILKSDLNCKLLLHLQPMQKCNVSLLERDQQTLLCCEFSRDTPRDS